MELSKCRGKRKHVYNRICAGGFGCTEIDINIGSFHIEEPNCTCSSSPPEVCLGLWIVDWTRDDEPEPLLINNITNCKCLRTLPNGGAPLIPRLVLYRMSCSVSELPAGCRLRGMGSQQTSAQQSSSNNSNAALSGNHSQGGVLRTQRTPCCFCWCCCCSCSW